MIDFVRRLTFSQISEFFDNGGKIIDIKVSEEKDILHIHFMDAGNHFFQFSIADNAILALGFHKTSEDWKVYLRKIFGEEYFRRYGEPSVESSFVYQLTIQDIKELLEQKNTQIASVEEREAFRSGTRRFRIEYLCPIHETYDVVIAPYYEYCSNMIGIGEKLFLNFFIKKFGMDFIAYYIGMEREKSDKKVEAYKIKCEEDVKRKKFLMLSIWQKG